MLFEVKIKYSNADGWMREHKGYCDANTAVDAISEIMFDQKISNERLTSVTVTVLPNFLSREMTIPRSKRCVELRDPPIGTY